MINIKRVLIVSGCLCCLFSCKQVKNQQYRFDDKSFKTAIKQCFQDTVFVAQGDFKNSLRTAYFIKSNYRLIDTIIWNNKIFYINQREMNSKRDQKLSVNISYPSKEKAVVKLEYVPGYSFKLIQTIRYSHENNGWKLTYTKSAIQDGEFK